YLNLNRQAGEIRLMYNYVPFMEEVIPQFEEETGIKIASADAYNNDEDWWAKINAGVKTDFLIGGTDWIQRVLAADLGTPLDLSKLSNLENLYPDFREAEYYIKDGESYAVPFTRVYYSMVYNTDEFSEAPSSWDITWDEAYSGQISIMDQAYAR